MTLYHQTVPVLLKYFERMNHILDKGAKYCEENGIPPDDMLKWKLHDDMKG